MSGIRLTYNHNEYDHECLLIIIIDNNNISNNNRKY